jgi:hypothetical protein
MSYEGFFLAYFSKMNHPVEIHKGDGRKTVSVILIMLLRKP